MKSNWFFVLVFEMHPCCPVYQKLLFIDKRHSSYVYNLLGTLCSSPPTGLGPTGSSKSAWAGYRILQPFLLSKGF